MRGAATRTVVTEEDDGPTRLKMRSRSASLDEFLLRLLREDRAVDEAGMPTDTSLKATVITIHKGRCDVLFRGQMRNCPLTPELERTQQTSIAVGDHVLLFQRGEHYVVDRVLPRKTKLSRPDPQTETRERVIVANIDVVVIVVSVFSPPLHPRLIDRFLVAVQRGGARPVIAVNKIDLLRDESELDVLDPYRPLGIPIVKCSAEAKVGLQDLMAELSGQTAAFVGHSGVGKSSLVQAIRPELDIEIGAVSGGNSRGSHTTRRSTMYQLGQQTQLIDTPGIRSFGLWALSADEVEESFPEFANLQCKFRNCTHTHEPQCAVRAAVDQGTVSEYRYETFLRLRESVS